ncbi:hypothetical protein [Cribrihabitans pelagius]|uniref:hypothetical protein n=1 Tax=Cribrihabitans pelagius TaxID=1765746 RepID=UPI003B5C8387
MRAPGHLLLRLMALAAALLLSFWTPPLHAGGMHQNGVSLGILMEGNGLGADEHANPCAPALHCDAPAALAAAWGETRLPPPVRTGYAIAGMAFPSAALDPALPPPRIRPGA